MVLLAPVDQVQDPGDRADADDLGEQVPQEELADQGQVEGRVPDLAERLDQGEEQAVEADEDEPVGGADGRPLEHPGVAERLDRQRLHAVLDRAEAVPSGWPVRMIRTIARTAR